MTLPEKSHKSLANLSRALWDSDLIGIRITLAMAEFAWMVMLLWPGETFLRPTYTFMAVIANEMLWALVFGLSCAAQIYILMSGDFNNRFARYFSLWNAVFWLYVGIISPLLSVFPPPAAMGGEMALASTSVWLWLRPYLLAKGVAYAERSN